MNDLHLAVGEALNAFQKKMTNQAETIRSLSALR